MGLMTKTSLSVLAGVAGTLFISYGVYFDRKRRSDPDFKKKLREKRKGKGDIDSGVAHLSNAVAVCGQPQQLLQVLQQTLPPQVFSLLLERLPSVGQRLMASAARSGMGMSEEDVE